MEFFYQVTFIYRYLCQPSITDVIMKSIMLCMYNIKDVVTVFQNKTINEALLIMQLIIDYIGYSIYKMSETGLCVCVCVCGCV